MFNLCNFPIIYIYIVLIDVFITFARESHIAGAPALSDFEVIQLRSVALCSLIFFNSFNTKAGSMDGILYDVSIGTLVLNIKPSLLPSKASARLSPTNIFGYKEEIPWSVFPLVIQHFFLHSSHNPGMI